MKKEFMAIASLAVILPTCKNGNTDKEKNPERLNILFIAVDDMKPLLGCYGDTLAHTPNIDQLAQSGMVFQNNYCQVPVCGASRASLLTGRYADNTRVWTFENMREGNPGVVTLPQYFKNNGYQTINLGKIFDYRTVDKFSDSVSWDYTFPVSEEDYYPHYNKETGIAATYYYQDPYVKNHYDSLKKELIAAGRAEDTLKVALKVLNPATECMDVPDDAYKDGIFAKLAVDQLEELAGGNSPFFLAVGFHKPHLPFVAPKKYWDLYQRENIPLAKFQEHAKDPLELAYHTSSELRNYTDERGNDIYAILKEGKVLPEDEQRKLIHGYLANVSYVDAMIGKIMDKLKEKGLDKNTIVVVWGDHGWHLGDHGMWGKATTFEQATWSPLLISKPGYKGEKTSMVSQFIDIYPTLCEMAGLEIPGELDGESLVPAMEGKQKDDFAISQWPHDDKMGYAIRTNRYRYVEWVEEGLHVNPGADLSKIHAVQLFDYQEDPLETVNLAGKEKYAEIQQMMADMLHEHYLGK